MASPALSRLCHELVMDQLVASGNAAGARAFAAEARMPMPSDETLDARAAVRNEIVVSGDVAKAVELVVEADAELLDEQPQLMFELATQRFVEMMRAAAAAAPPPNPSSAKAKGKDQAHKNNADDETVMELLRFANAEFAPLVKRHPELQPKLEEIMSLLALEDVSSSPLLSLSRRVRVANDVNAAMYARSRSRSSDPSGAPPHARSKLVTLLGVAKWADDELNPEGGERLPEGFFDP